MEPKLFYGKITPQDLADALIGEFNRGNLRAQVFGNDEKKVVQIATRDAPLSGGATALTVTLQKIEDGVSVLVGQQNWLGVAASLSQTAITTWINPFNIINRLDDLAQDIEHLQLEERTWMVIENQAKSAGVSQELSARYKRLSCNYCGSANVVGASNCISCGAPLGDIQPKTCISCGFLIQQSETKCPNCGRILI